MGTDKADQLTVQTRALLAMAGLLGCVIASLVLSKLTLVVVSSVWRAPSSVELRLGSPILVFGWLGVIYYVLQRAMKTRIGGQNLGTWFNNLQAEWREEMKRKA